MKDPLLETEEETCVAIPQLYRLIDEGLRDLVARVEYLHRNWRAPTDEGKAQYSWCLLLGILSHDIVSSIVDLIRADRLRGAQILARCLYEYELRLWVYRADPAEALQDNEKAPIELRRFLESHRVEGARAFGLSAEQIDRLEQFISENPGRFKTRDVYKDILRSVDSDEKRAQFLYLGRYGFASTFVHGSALAFRDVIHAEGEETFLHWRSSGLRTYALVMEAAFRLINIIELIETTSERFQAHVVLRRKFEDIIRAHAQRFNNTVDARKHGNDESVK